MRRTTPKELPPPEEKKESINRELFLLEYINHSFDYLLSKSEINRNNLQLTSSVFDVLLHKQPEDIPIHFVQNIKQMKYQDHKLQNSYQEYGDFINYQQNLIINQQVTDLEQDLQNQIQIRTNYFKIFGSFKANSQQENQLAIMSKALEDQKIKQKQKVMESLISNYLNQDISSIPDEDQLQKSQIYRLLFDISKIKDETMEGMEEEKSGKHDQKEKEVKQVKMVQQPEGKKKQTTEGNKVKEHRRGRNDDEKRKGKPRKSHQEEYVPCAVLTGATKISSPSRQQAVNENIDIIEDNLHREKQEQNQNNSNQIKPTEQKKKIIKKIRNNQPSRKRPNLHSDQKKLKITNSLQLQQKPTISLENNIFQIKQMFENNINQREQQIQIELQEVNEQNVLIEEQKHEKQDENGASVNKQLSIDAIDNKDIQQQRIMSIQIMQQNDNLNEKHENLEAKVDVQEFPQISDENSMSE